MRPLELTEGGDSRVIEEALGRVPDVSSGGIDDPVMYTGTPPSLACQAGSLLPTPDRCSRCLILRLGRVPHPQVLSAS